MKVKIIAIALFLTTIVVVLVYPGLRNNLFAAETPNVVTPTQISPNQAPKIDVVFVLDTTGSMGGLIQAAKEKIWSIASSMASAKPAPVIRMGLVAYRDRGDSYVTKVVDLSADLDTLYVTLMDFRAEGGGDGPESVNQGLYDAVNKLSWSADQSVYKAVFLVGDAPPHMDYQDDVKYPVTLELARQRGIVVNTIQCGTETDTKTKWQQIAQLGQGGFFEVGQSGNAVALTTPFDKKLAELSAKLDETRLYYGNAEEKAKNQAKQAATEKLHVGASVESRARRAAFNVSKSGKANFAGDKELVDDISSGRVKLEKIERDKLPAPLQSMAPAAQKAVVEETAKKRLELEQEIGALSRQRADYLSTEVVKTGGAKDSLDQQIYGVVREQAAKKGLYYEAATPAY